MSPTQCPNILKTSGICHFINISFIPIGPFPNASGNKSIFSFNIFKVKVLNFLTFKNAFFFEQFLGGHFRAT